mmetsp:Transcript_137681/g.326161  ORF Transcript_137681/g.326161 Transcript_137681/m.326161 type:complete len:223 (+) Transcript_137681:410-1078(+)
MLHVLGSQPDARLEVDDHGILLLIDILDAAGNPPLKAGAQVTCSIALLPKHDGVGISQHRSAKLLEIHNTVGVPVHLLDDVLGCAPLQETRGIRLLEQLLHLVDIQSPRAVQVNRRKSGADLLLSHAPLCHHELSHKLGVVHGALVAQQSREELADLVLVQARFLEHLTGLLHLHSAAVVLIQALEKAVQVMKLSQIFLGDQLMRQQILNLLLLAHLVHGVH